MVFLSKYSFIIRDNVFKENQIIQNEDYTVIDMKVQPNIAF